MERKSTVLLIICLSIAVCGVSLFAFYTRPLTIEQRFPELDLSQCTQLWGYYSVNGKNDEQVRFNFYPADTQFNEIVNLFSTTRFRTRMGNILPSNIKTHRYNEGDYQWTISFRFEEVFSNRSVLSGDVLRVDDFFGDIEISFDGEQTKCSVKGQSLWLERVLTAIMQYVNE